MNAPRDRLARDLQALRYLGALNAGDLETVAALWGEASRDPELERILAELDGALFVESAAANGDTGAVRVSGLSPNPPPASRRRWAGWIGVVAALATAGVLAVLVGSRHDSKAPEPNPTADDSGQQVTRPAPDDVASIPAWPEGRRVVDETETPSFHWPLPEEPPSTFSTAIPPDLLD
jgi:hypothetical protein